MDLLAAGKVSVLLLAGGQGTRLGFDHPKGMYDVGLKSHKTLFHMQAEQIARLTKLALAHGAKKGIAPPTRPLIKLYILTSDATHAETVEYFEQNNYFGLTAEGTRFFQQGMLPAVAADGRVLLASRSSLVLSPNGNGGVHQALIDCGVVDELERNGVEYLFQYCVDNVLVKIADPVFMGFMHSKHADCASKAVAKAHPDEPVGVLCTRGGRPGVAEYTELATQARHMVDARTGRLVYSASHICVNAFSVPFLRRNALLPLPLHLAHKRSPFVGPDGEVVTPAEPNAYKAEMFIFDIFQYADNMHALLAERGDEFSPLKNPRGSKSDCPETCLHDLQALGSRSGPDDYRLGAEDRE
eukprot:TRINITY_DN5319_c0_g1_i2.p1 TRINITY_DN5319_c0_g1~~TRINITY_DN5319_c0_g1_i2.p1  ORF type:complete len:356 (-),score=104.33 TRINITY_DN5319_c0_g1_i2:89-1156(-)